MNTYWDSSVLAKVYMLEPESEAAVRRARVESPLRVIRLHEVEVRNAIRAKQFRNEIEPAQAEQAVRWLEMDLASGVLVQMDPDPEALYRTVRRLVDGHTPAIGCRALDILHVAAALEFGCIRFRTQDARQARLARAAGLHGVRLDQA